MLSKLYETTYSRIPGLQGNQVLLAHQILELCSYEIGTTSSSKLFYGMKTFPRLRLQDVIGPATSRYLFTAWCLARQRDSGSVLTRLKTDSLHRLKIYSVDPGAGFSCSVCSLDHLKADYASRIWMGSSLWTSLKRYSVWSRLGNA